MNRATCGLLVLSIVAAVAVPPYRVPPSSNGQLPLESRPTQQQTGWDVRRYPLTTPEDRDDILVQAMAHDLDVWSLTQHNADIRFPTHGSVPEYFTSRNYTRMLTSAEVDPESLRPPRPTDGGPWNLTSLSSCTFHNAYHPLDEIDSFIHQLAEAHPDRVELITLGRTSEGRTVEALNISKRRKGKKGKKGKKAKRRLVIQGAQHAREWVATSTALYVAHALLADKSDPLSKSKLLNRDDFTIIPLPNPDGYVYTWEHDRLWYKNRADVGGGEECKGIDLNRNWDFEWTPPTESNPCSHWYPGHQPFEALETRAVSEYIKRTPNIRGFLDLRSYGQIIMHPFSHSCDHHPKDEENLLEAALGAAKAMSQRHGTHIGTGSLCHELYRAPGNAVDWMYGYAGVPVTYSVMLRDTGTYGFLLPARQIRPVGEETADMVDYLARWIKKHKA